LDHSRTAGVEILMHLWTLWPIVHENFIGPRTAAATVARSDACMELGVYNLRALSDVAVDDGDRIYPVPRRRVHLPVVDCGAGHWQPIE